MEPYSKQIKTTDISEFIMYSITVRTFRRKAHTQPNIQENGIKYTWTQNRSQYYPKFNARVKASNNFTLMQQLKHKLSKILYL